MTSLIMTIKAYQCAISKTRSKAQVYVLISQRKLPHIRLGQKRVVVRREHLEEWLRTQTVLAR